MGRLFNPGAFRHKITFLTPPDKRDEYGAVTGEWGEFKRVYASAEPLLGRELYSAMMTESRVEVKFRTRYIPGISDTMRIEFGGGIYEILSAADVESKHKELLLYCRERREEQKHE